MEALVDEFVVSPEQLEQYRCDYATAVREGKPHENSRFTYAWGLVCTNNRKNIKEGTEHLKDMLKASSQTEPSRTYLFYLAVASIKLKEYQNALSFLEALHQIEPKNNQADMLHVLIEKRMKRDGALGATVVGAAVLGGAALAGVIGMAGVALLVTGLKKM